MESIEAQSNASVSSVARKRLGFWDRRSLSSHLTRASATLPADEEVLDLLGTYDRDSAGKVRSQLWVLTDRALVRFQSGTSDRFELDGEWLGLSIHDRTLAVEQGELRHEYRLLSQRNALEFASRFRTMWFEASEAKSRRMSEEHDREMERLTQEMEDRRRQTFEAVGKVGPVDGQRPGVVEEWSGPWGSIKVNVSVVSAAMWSAWRPQSAWPEESTEVEAGETGIGEPSGLVSLPELAPDASPSVRAFHSGMQALCDGDRSSAAEQLSAVARDATGQIADAGRLVAGLLLAPKPGSEGRELLEAVLAAPRLIDQNGWQEPPESAYADAWSYAPFVFAATSDTVLLTTDMDSSSALMTIIATTLRDDPPAGMALLQHVVESAEELENPWIEMAVRLALADLHAAAEDWEAVTELTASIDAPSSDEFVETQALFLLQAHALAGQGLADAAVDRYSQMVASQDLDSGMRNEALYARGSLLLAGGRRRQALRDFSEVYASNPAYRDVKALIAKANLKETSNSRAPIPREVRDGVWRRDEGRCVECGSQENLEFDHVIPIALGGSNTERNLQLLCEECNRRKGANV